MYLVSATPGTGKTCWVVKQLLEWIELPENRDRKIYANIAGLKIEGIDYPPDDFRECPDGSIIIYDEAQEIEHYNSDSRGVNPVAKALSKHRHRGFDIYFISQDPSLLHKYVLKNIYLHYYLWRPAQRQNVEIFTFARAIVSPTKEDFRNAYDVKWWRFDKHYLKYYQSTVLNTSKPTPSSKKWSIIATFCIFMAMIAYFLYPALSLGEKLKNPTGVKKEQKQQDSEKTTQEPVAEQPQPQAQNASVPASTVTATEYQPPTPQPIAPVQPVTRIVGVASFGVRCTAYLNTGQIANISQDECNEYATGRKLIDVLEPVPTTNNNYNANYAQQAELSALQP